VHFANSAGRMAGVAACRVALRQHLVNDSFV
jgi:hypothetical protein